MSLQRLPLGLAVAIEFIGPFSVALFNSRRVTDFVWLFLAVCGLALLLPFGESSANVDPIGVAYALAAAGTWALYIVVGQKAGHAMHTGIVTGFGVSIAVLVGLPFGLGTAGAKLLQPDILQAGFIVALFSSAIPFTFDMVALKRLPTRTFGILMSLEPALAAFSGFLLLSENLSLRQIAAIACIIAASFGSTASARAVVPLPPEN
jgi:inner membrane transporter RhtA